MRLAPADTIFLQAMYLAFPDDFGSDDEPPPGLMSHKQKREQMQGANRAKGSAKGKRRRVGTANRSSGPTNEMQLEAKTCCVHLDIQYPILLKIIRILKQMQI